MKALAGSAEEAYRTFPQRKRGRRDVRLISEPDLALKVFQHQLAALLREYLPVAPIEYARRRGGALAAARVQSRARGAPRSGWVGQLDIRDFYPSVTRRHIEVVLVNLGCRPPLVEILLNLTTWKRSLPQGAPTSPILAAAVLHPALAEVEREAARLGVRVVHYVDNLYVSGGPRACIEATIDHYAERIAALGMTTHRRSVLRRNRSRVLGFSVHGRKPRIPGRYRNRLRQEVRWAASRGMTVKERRALLGKLAYIRSHGHRREADRLEKLLRRPSHPPH